MAIVNLYPDTDCNSGTCGRVVPSIGGKEKSSIEATTLREAVAEANRRWPDAEVRLEGLKIKESMMDQIIGGFTRNEALGMGAEIL
jgi:hypothetical protein